MNIGKYKLYSKVLLAPMAGTSDKPFRMICRDQGAGLTTSEMVVIQNHLMNSNKSKHRLDFSSEKSPISVQIAGSEADELASSAKKALEFGADIVDINMGCPAKKVCNKAAGSALMQNEKLVEEIIKSVVNSVDVPVTLKMRTGWDDENKNAPTIAKIAEDNGIQMIAIHGRTRAQMYKGDASWEKISEVKNNNRMSIPVFGNGDVNTPQAAKRMRDEYGLDGAMIGRGSIGNPWIFEEIKHFFKTGQIKKPPTLKQRAEMAKKHLQLSLQWKGEVLGVLETRRHYGNYFKGVENFKSTKTAILTENDPNKIITILDGIKDRQPEIKTLV